MNTVLRTVGTELVRCVCWLFVYFSIIVITLIVVLCVSYFLLCNCI